jgi:hypothetical protein
MTAGAGSRIAGSLSRAARVGGAAAAAAVLTAVAGCAGAGLAPPGPHVTGTGPGGSPSASRAAASSSPTGSAGVPTLGRLAGVFARGEGFGQVKPARVFNGGDPTGLVTHITWQTWGGPTAVGTGTGDYVGARQTVAEGRLETARIVAFDLGPCGGKLMYRAVEWFFPRHGQAFNPGRYEDICNGSYVPAP